MNNQHKKTYSEPNSIAESIEDAMGFRSKTKSISLGIKLGILTAVLTALYFFIFKMVSFDSYILVYISKFFVVGGIMTLGFLLFKPTNQRPTFMQGLRLSGTITVSAAISFLLLQAFMALIGSPAYFEPELYQKVANEGTSMSIIGYMIFLISFIEVVIYGMIAGIANILYFTRPLKTSKRSFNRNENEKISYPYTKAA